MTSDRQSGSGPPCGEPRSYLAVPMLLVAIAVGVLCGWATFSLTRPSDGELQRAVLDEFGLPEELEAAPVIGPMLDQYTTHVSRRVVQESRRSATLAYVVSVTVALAVSTGSRVAWRRRTTAPSDLVSG